MSETEPSNNRYQGPYKMLARAYWIANVEFARFQAEEFISNATYIGKAVCRGLFEGMQGPSSRPVTKWVQEETKE